jgi:hypothetical protein
MLLFSFGKIAQTLADRLIGKPSLSQTQANLSIALALVA